MNCIVVWLMLALAYQSAWADRVVPSNRVETQLNVRAAPNSTAAVGAQQPGDSARFVRSVPHWYEITLDNGTPGFVSKAWSLVVADPAPLVTDSIRLGGWNIKKLGHGASTNFDLVVQIIDLNFARSATDEEELYGTSPQHRLGHKRRATTDIYMRGRRAKRVKPLPLRKAS